MKNLLVGLMCLMFVGCASSKKQQRKVLNMIKGEVEKSHYASCDEIKAYLYRLEIKIDNALSELE